MPDVLFIIVASLVVLQLFVSVSLQEKTTQLQKITQMSSVQSKSRSNNDEGEHFISRPLRNPA